MIRATLDRTTDTSMSYLDVNTACGGYGAGRQERPTSANLLEQCASSTDLVGACGAVTDTLDDRVPRETGREPIDVLVEERHHLHVLPCRCSRSRRSPLSARGAAGGRGRPDDPGWLSPLLDTGHVTPGIRASRSGAGSAARQWS